MMSNYSLFSDELYDDESKEETSKSCFIDFYLKMIISIFGLGLIVMESKDIDLDLVFLLTFLEPFLFAFKWVMHSIYEGNWIEEIHMMNFL